MNQEERDQKLMEWHKLSMMLADIKQREMELRKELAFYFLGGESLESPPYVKVKLGNGYGIKATNNLNYNLDSIDRIESVIDELHQLGKTDVATSVFKWKASLSESAYKALDKQTQEIINRVLKIKVGSPSLELIKPKAKE